MHPKHPAKRLEPRALRVGIACEEPAIPATSRVSHASPTTVQNGRDRSAGRALRERADAAVASPNEPNGLFHGEQRLGAALLELLELLPALDAVVGWLPK